MTKKQNLTKKCWNGKIHDTVCIGDKVRLTDMAKEYYGIKEDEIFTISYITNSEGGYDKSMYPELLVDIDGESFKGAVYEYEFELVEKLNTAKPLQSIANISVSGDTTIDFTKSSGKELSRGA